MKEIYALLSSAMGRENELGQIANNLANVSTTAFKRDGAVFENYLALEAAASGEALLPGTPSLAALTRAYTDFTRGQAIETGGTLDLMIDGPGFFMVEGEAPITRFYTRSGALRLNAAGELVTADGRRILGVSGTPIALDLKGGEPAIETDGTIVVAGETVATIGLVEFSDLTQLTHYGHGLFEGPENITPPAAQEPNIRQGFLEGSNTNVIQEMVRMIEAQRSYEALQRAMQTIDGIYGQRIGQILNG